MVPSPNTQGRQITECMYAILKYDLKLHLDDGMPYIRIIVKPTAE